MIFPIIKFFTPPYFADREKNFSASVLHTILVASLLLSLASIIPVAILNPDGAYFLLACIVGNIISLHFNNKGIAYNPVDVFMVEWLHGYGRPATCYFEIFDV